MYLFAILATGKFPQASKQNGRHREITCICLGALLLLQPDKNSTNGFSNFNTRHTAHISFLSLFKNSSFLLCKNLSTLASLFVFAVLLAQYLGKEALGLFTLFSAILVLFSFLVDFGQSTSLIQEINRKSESSGRIIENSILLKIFLTMGASFILFLFSQAYFDTDQTRHLFWIFGLILLPRAVYSTFEAGFHAKQKMTYSMWVGIFTAILLVLGSWILLRLNFGFGSIVAFLVVLETVKAILIWALYRGVMNFRFREGVKTYQVLFSGLARKSMPFFLLGLIGTFYVRIDIMLLAFLRDTSDVGIFSAANSFFKVMQVVPSVVIASYFPAISGFRRNSPEVKFLTSKTLWLQFSLSLFMAIIILLLSEFLIATTFGFSESPRILRFLVWAIIPYSLYSTLIYAFFQTDRIAVSIKILSAALILNVGLNLLLIPKLGVMSLALTQITSETFCVILFFGVYLYQGRKTKHSLVEDALPQYESEVSELSVN
jgi:O-antigen/teichoic acid export membrane protein